MAKPSSYRGHEARMYECGQADFSYPNEGTVLRVRKLGPDDRGWLFECVYQRTRTARYISFSGTQILDLMAALAEGLRREPFSQPVLVGDWARIDRHVDGISVECADDDRFGCWTTLSLAHELLDDLDRHLHAGEPWGWRLAYAAPGDPLREHLCRIRPMTASVQEPHPHTLPWRFPWPARD